MKRDVQPERSTQLGRPESSRRPVDVARRHRLAKHSVEAILNGNTSGVWVEVDLHRLCENARTIVESACCGADLGLPFHVKVDTGMGRTGVRWDERDSITRLGGHQPEGVFAHLFAADESPETIPLQWTRFQ